MSPTGARLVLASASPRRQELLAGLGVAFTVRVADVDETPRPGEAVEPLVLRLAREKATAVAEPGDVVIAADTMVSCDGRLLGKPVDEDEAASMLRTLSGRTHEVTTGVVVVAEREATTAVVSRVTFVDLRDEDIAWYLATGEPFDKAGAYGLQGIGARFVRSIDGSPTNVIGLPLAETVEALAAAGHPLATFAVSPPTPGTVTP